MPLLRPQALRHLHLIERISHPRPLPTLIAMSAAAAIAQFPPAAVAVALPSIHEELNASLGELQWTITAYTLATSAFLIAFGRLADTFGRRRILLIGTALFAAGSAVSALAGSALMVIAGTVIAGTGAAALTPASLSIVVSAYPPERRGLPIGVWGAAGAIMQGFGPLLGGALTTGLGWQWVFWPGALVAGMVVAVTLWSTAESRDPQAERHVDTVGVGLAAAALFTLSLAVIQGPTWGFGAPQTLILLGAALALGLGFVVFERRAAAPLVNFSMFRARNFTGATIVLFALNFALIVALFFLPLYLQEIQGSSASESGVQMLPLMVAMVLLLPVGGLLVERIGPLVPIVAGLGLAALGLVLLSRTDPATELSDLFVPMALVGGGSAVALTPMNVAAMNAIPTRQSGAAGGLFTTLSGIGIGFGVAMSGALFHSRQLSETERLVDATGTDITSAQAERLDGLLAGGSEPRAFLERLGGNPEAIEAAVRQAFTDALGDAYLLGAAVALVALGLTAWLIRNRPPADEVAGAADPG